MKFHSITFKLLFFIFFIFAMTTVTVLTLANIKLNRIIDNSQHAVYSEKLATILGILQTSQKRLKKTGLAEAYESQFKASAVKALQHSFYNKTQHQVVPFIIDSYGRVVMHQSETVGGIAGIVTQTGKQRFDEPAGHFNYENGGQRYWCIFKRFPQWDWIVAYTVPFQVKYADANAFWRVLLIIFSGFGLVGMVPVFIGVTRMTRPIVSLTKASRQMAKGNLDQKIDLTGSDETAVLAKSFNEMQASIKLKIKELNKEVAERKKREEEIRSLRNYLSNIIDSMPSVLVGVDKNGCITLWNSRAEAHTKVSFEAAVGKPLEQVFPELSGKLPRVQEAINTRRVCSDPRQARKKEGSTAYEDVTIYPLSGNGEEGAVIRVDDVTEKVKLEEMMIQSEKMLSVGGLAAGMAHEINNPLAGMMQTANVMNSRLQNIEMPANLKAAQKIGISMGDIRAFMEKRGILQMLEVINESGMRIAEIVSNMLSFARKSDAEVALHHPVELMEQILKLAVTDYDLKKRYDFKTIKIVKAYAKDLPMLPCEGAKIQQVLLNILRNGAEAMQMANQGQPCFTIRISADENTGMIQIEIQDNGPGMDKAVQTRIFEPFFTTKPPGMGTGLGLSVSYYIITENHKGTMEVVSAPGEGANFIIRLPQS